MGVDWGFSNPACLLIAALDRDNRLRVLDEFYESQVQMGQLVEIAKEMTMRYNVHDIFCDPSEPMFIDQFRQAGLPARSANNDVVPGIQAILAYFVDQLDERPRFGIAERCPNLIREMQTYHWRRGRDGQYKKDEPVKEHDHACDALRYAVQGAGAGNKYGFDWA